MIDQAGVTIAQAIAALGATGILALVFVLWLTGRLHSDSETKQDREDREKERAQEQEQWRRELEYREAMRLEAVADRKAADARVEQFTAVIKEQNELTRRALDLNERLMEEFVRPAASRTRRTDRD